MSVKKKKPLINKDFGKSDYVLGVKVCIKLATFNQKTRKEAG
jgi:hypothetical protein